MNEVMVECGLVGATTFHLVYPAFLPAYSGVAVGRFCCWFGGLRQRLKLMEMIK